MKVTKTEIRFKTGFQQPKTGLPKKPVLTSLSVIPTYTCETWWLTGRFDAFHPKGCGFESRSGHHVGTLGKSFTLRCLWHFGVKLLHSIFTVSGVPLSSSGLEEAL